MRSLPLPTVVEVSHGAVSRLEEVMAMAGLDATDMILVAGEDSLERVGDGWALEHATSVVSPEGATVEDARMLANLVGDGGVIVAIGGGRTIDVAKYAAAIADRPFVPVATNLAHDGIASPVAVLEMDGHRQSLAGRPPDAIVVDLAHVASDGRAWRAGVGDVVSNISAVSDWRLAAAVRGDRVDGLAAAMASTAAESVLHNTDGSGSAAFLTSLAQALILSGLAMATAGTSRPSSGAEHEISHAIDKLFPGDRLHGEQAAVGTLFVEYLREGPHVTAINDCFIRNGVPRLPADIGLTLDEFASAVKEAPSTRPDRYTLLEHLSLDDDSLERVLDEFSVAFG